MASRTPYYIAFAFFVIHFVLLLVGFGTGYWLIAEGEGRLFKRLGLWEACFEGYEHTSDYIGKAYYGCWWIFHKEYSYIRDWLLPPWFVAVQTLMTFAVVFGFIGLAVYPMAGGEIYPKDSIKKQKMATFISTLSTLCIGISLTVFGAMIGEDRTWVPRPDIDSPGWSFGVCVIAAFFAAFSLISMSTYTCMLKWESLPKDNPDAGHQKKKMLPMVPRV